MLDSLGYFMASAFAALALLYATIQLFSNRCVECGNYFTKVTKHKDSPVKGYTTHTTSCERCKNVEDEIIDSYGETRAVRRRKAA